MNIDTFLLPAFFSIVAAFITAAISIVKLVNDKVSKTTDYRQAWTTSARSSFADLIGVLNDYSASIHNTKVLIAKCNRIRKNRERDPSSTVLQDEYNAANRRLEAIGQIVRESRRKLYEKYALSQLHFKPDDEHFKILETEFRKITAEFEKMWETEQSLERKTIKKSVRKSVDEISKISRILLKNEWETVKKGEPAYLQTKKWATWIGVFFGVTFIIFIVLIIIKQNKSDNHDVKKIYIEIKVNK